VAQFDSVAEGFTDYIALINSMDHWIFLKNIPKSRERVLDIGCGGGLLSGKLRTYFQEVIGIDISEQKSKTIDEHLLREMDFVVTLCFNAEDLCPSTPPGTKRIYWPIKDPVGMLGTEEEVMNEFRRTRDEIKGRVLKLREELFP
jgi:SAM-dependent methyltransferase